MAGKRFVAASCASSARVVPNIGSEIVRRASARHAVSAANALASSCGWRTSRTCNSTARARATSRVSCKASLDTGLTGFHRTATRATWGIAVLRSSRCFPLRPEVRLDSPVAFPPGRARLATSPVPTGSPGTVNTIGTVVVSASAACEEFGGEWGKLLDHPVGIAILDDDILALGVAKVVQPLPKHGEEGIRWRTLCEHADPGN